MSTDIVKLAGVFLVMSATNAASERIRIGPRKVHVYTEDVEKMNTIEIASEFIESLRKKCPNTVFFLVRIFLYSVQIQENTGHKNSVFGDFSRSDTVRHDY